MTSVWFHPEARAELRTAVEFYQNRSQNLGREFALEVRAMIDQIRDLPRSGSPQETSLRRVVLARFPFSLVYRMVEDGIEIVAVMHHRQRPGYWRDRT